MVSLNGGLVLLNIKFVVTMISIYDAAVAFVEGAKEETSNILREKGY